jgi:hypothetical protein
MAGCLDGVKQAANDCSVGRRIVPKLAQGDGAAFDCVLEVVKMAISDTLSDLINSAGAKYLFEIKGSVG